MSSFIFNLLFTQLSMPNICFTCCQWDLKVQDQYANGMMPNLQTWANMWPSNLLCSPQCPWGW